MARRLIIVSGCSGGGKSTLLATLSARGFTAVDEPGRRIVESELAATGRALPWINPRGFAQRAVALSLADLAAVSDLGGPVFFDRGLGDALAALAHCGDADPKAEAKLARFDRRVFMAPPWREIYHSDRARQHGFEAAVDEYHRLCAFYPARGFEVITLPKTSVPDRVAFVLERSAHR